MVNISKERTKPLAMTETLDGDFYDYYQQIARAAFADMLHDNERNQLYDKALKIAIDKMHSLNKKANVLDIGTGTGLLSMMAARNGADSIIACEEFQPMSQLANRLIELNGFKDKILIIPKRSTQLTVSETGDLKKKCNILVTEVFDTELIGEYALETFKHAHEYLLEKDCIVVPDNATVYVQVVECPLAQSWNKLKNIYNDDLEIILKVPEAIKSCAGNQNLVHDIQLSQLPISSFTTLVPPTAVFSFDWSGRSAISFERSSCKTIQVVNNGVAQMVFFWWTLQMDVDGNHILSCAPYWAHPKSQEKLTEEIPWRDHWIQGIYFFPNSELIVKKNEQLNLFSFHDKLSFWFDISTSNGIERLCRFCECGVHNNFSRARIGQMNDAKRQKTFLRIIEKHVNVNSTVIVLGDCFYYALVACKFGAKIVYVVVESNPHLTEILEQFIHFNNIKNAVIIKNIEELKKITIDKDAIVLGEPFFCNNIFSGDNIRFFQIVNQIKQFVPSDVKVFPNAATLKGVAVNFDNLYKIKSVLGQVEGFSVQPYDEMIMNAIKCADSKIDVQPLWEYSGRAASNEFAINKITQDAFNGPELNLCIQQTCEKNLPYNGIALWLDWHFDEKIISIGPTQPIIIGKHIQWYMHAKQGVVLYPELQISKDLSIALHFDCKTNAFDISIEKNMLQGR